MKKFLSLVLCLTLLLSSTVTFAAKPQKVKSRGFSDLAPGHWAYKSVMQMVKQGILEGFDDGSFRPNESVTRAQFAKILVSSLGLSLTQNSGQTFADVSANDWSYPYVQAAQHFLTGYRQNGQLYFRGNNVAVREDMAVAVVIAKGLNSETQVADLSVLNSFSDSASISEGLRTYIAIAVKNNIMDGYGNGLFGPQNTLTRAEAAELMYKSGILKDNGDKVVVGDDGDKVVIGDDDNTDITAPRVTNTTPANGAMDVVLGSPITVKFSEPVYINSDNFTVYRPNGTAVTIRLSLDGKAVTRTGRDINGTTLVATSSELMPGVTYTVKIANSFVKDLAGNSMNNPYVFSFTTKAADTIRVVSTSPANWATGVEINTPVTIEYSETFTTNTPIWTATSYYDVSNPSIVRTADGVMQGNKLVFPRLNNLDQNMTYVFKVEGLGNAANGKKIDNCKFTFTTKSLADITGPKVVSTTPANGATGVETDPSIVIKYSEPLSELWGGDILITGPDGKFVTPAPPTINLESGEVRINPQLAYNSKYIVNLPTPTDKAGNKGVPYTFSFTTKFADGIAPTVTVNPAGGSSVYAGSRINVSVSDSTGVSIVKYYWDNQAPTQVGPDASVPFVVVVPILNGTHVLHVYAEDKGGTGTTYDYTYQVKSAGPVVINTAPVNGETGIDTNRIIVITFSKNITYGTNWNNINFKDSNGLSGVGYQVSYSISGSQVIFTPFPGLQAGMTYTAYLPSGAVKDMDGNGNPSDVRVVFTTKEIYLNPPVASVNSGTYTAPISVTFDKSVYEAGTKIIYTLDGSEPSGMLGITPPTIEWDGNPITINKTTFLKVRAMRDYTVTNGGYAGPVATYNYTINSIQAN